MQKIKKLKIGLVILCLLVASLSYIPKALAGTLTHTSVIETGTTAGANPMIAADPQTVVLALTPAATGAPSAFTVTFTGWTGGSAGAVNATQTVATGSCTSIVPGATAVPGTLAGSGNAGTGVITITGATSMTAGTNYCTTLTSVSAVTNPTATGVYSVTVNTGTDSQTVGIDVLTSATNAYSITGTVAPTFTMALTGGPTDTFPTNLSSSAITVSNGITTTINTNAASGWFVWATDSNAGLHSTTAGHTIGSVATTSNHTFTTGTDQYGLGVSANNAPFYAYGGGTTGAGLANGGTYNEIATSTSPASAVTFVTHELAEISATTPPGSDYTDTITEIGAGSF
jgi:hypothetical protein